MIHIKNTVHALKVKWMHCLCKDAGSSWSRFAWPEIATVIPEQLWTGLCSVPEMQIAHLDPFYAHMLRSFAMTNNLMYEEFDTAELPQNLWGGALFSCVPQTQINAGFFTTFNLPVLSGRIDVNEVNSQLAPHGLPADSFLKCCTFQTFFASFLNSAAPGTFVSCEELVSRSKLLLQSQSSHILSLDGQVYYLCMVPLDIPHLEKIFHHMLVACKITKFKEVNYKILSRILLTPKLLSRIVTKPELQWCV